MTNCIFIPVKAAAHEVSALAASKAENSISAIWLPQEIRYQPPFLEKNPPDRLVAPSEICPEMGLTILTEYQGSTQWALPAGWPEPRKSSNVLKYKDEAGRFRFSLEYTQNGQNVLFDFAKLHQPILFIQPRFDCHIVNLGDQIISLRFRDNLENHDEYEIGKFELPPELKNLLPEGQQELRECLEIRAQRSLANFTASYRPGLKYPCDLWNMIGFTGDNMRSYLLNEMTVRFDALCQAVRHACSLPLLLSPPQPSTIGHSSKRPSLHLVQ